MKIDQVFSEAQGRQAVLACRLDLLGLLLTESARYAQNFRKSHGDIDAAAKTDRSPVTEIDYLIQAVFAGAIARCFPNDLLLGEERLDDAMIRRLEVDHEALFRRVDGRLSGMGSDSSASVRWILDPIDGTRGFIRDLVYAIGVILLVEDCPVASGIAACGLDQVFELLDSVPVIATAVAGGAEPRFYYEDGRPLDRFVEPATKTILVSRHEMASLTPEAETALSRYDLAGIDSMAKYVAVAMGLSVGYLRAPITRPAMIWDHLPGMFLVAAAGGSSVDFNGDAIEFDAVEGTVDLSAGLISCCDSRWTSKFIEIVPQSRLHDFGQ